MLHKISTGQAAIPAKKILQPVKRQTRSNHILAYQRLQASKNAYANSYFPQTIKDWNNLPQSIATITDNEKFKRAVTSNISQQTNPQAARTTSN
jgi:hypothetical protein